ncbi:hypothetical protein RchiOBHm_Chr7g0223071 [Rosa chinensis]|uniref:Uncharacterized protein n=1 Tax=Rosa chinensis TaxID=74649 RepID=A0A2P6PDG2_ROSCH|nr:hypothetical protein RchiOBHm_Chr7g0223071 [Rosa chinensis]
MEDEFFDDLMVLYIEKEFADSIDNDSVIAEFELSGSRGYDLVSLLLFYNKCMLVVFNLWGLVLCPLRCMF